MDSMVSTSPGKKTKQNLTGISGLKILIQEINLRLSVIEETNIKAGVHELEEEIAQLQAKIEKKRSEWLITNLESELSDLQAEYSTLLQQVGQSITAWQPDKFSHGAKDVYAADGLKILRSSRTVREIRANEFFETYPFLAPKIAKCTIKDAEKHVPGAELDRFCTKKVTFSYEVARWLESGRQHE